MSFENKINDVLIVNIFKKVLRRKSSKVFTMSDVPKIKTIHGQLIYTLLHCKVNDSWQDLPMKMRATCQQSHSTVLCSPELSVGPLSSTHLNLTHQTTDPTQPNPSQSKNFGLTSQPNPQPITQSNSDHRQ